MKIVDDLLGEGKKSRSTMCTWGLQLRFIPFGWNAVFKCQYVGNELLQVRMLTSRDNF